MTIPFKDEYTGINKTTVIIAEEKVMCGCSLSKAVGIAVCTFGLGVMVAFFLPESVLVVLEAVVIITAGVIFLKA